MGNSILTRIAPKIEEKIGRLIAKHRVVGAACGIVLDQELVWSAGFGFADLASGRPPDRDTIFRVGSITKTFTAAALMKLRDKGLLSADDPIARFIPEFKSVKAKFGTIEDITLRRLMAHHSGLMTEAPLEHWTTLEFPTIDQVLATLPQAEIVVAPDSEFKYSNLGYSLLGEVIARVSKTPYVDYIQREILDPLGMRTSGFEVSEQMRPNLAIGYQLGSFTDEPMIAPTFHVKALTSAGQLYSSVTDLAKWVSLQFRTEAPTSEGTQVLRGSTLAEMHRVHYLDDAWEIGYGLAWRAFRRPDAIYHRASGGIHGFISYAGLSLRDRVGVIVLTNSMHRVFQEIAWQILDEVIPVVREAQTPRVNPTPVAAPASVRRFLGVYQNPCTPWGDDWFKVVWRDASLAVLEALPGFPITRLRTTEDANVFIQEPGGERMVFESDAGGTVCRARTAGYVNVRIAGNDRKVP